MSRARILVGDCRESMAALPAESVDAVVCDPPYELGFMGKGWDTSGIAYDVEVWRQALRVLKPGGHLLAFSGSRTYHRMTCAIEDAGFEIRDQIMWVYGSGFPKSLDVSKAIDKIDRAEAVEARARAFTAWMRSTGITAQQINAATGTMMGHHYTTHPTQPTVATADLFDLLRPMLPAVPAEIEQLVRDRTVESENMKRREVVGTHQSTSPGYNMRTGMLGVQKYAVGVRTIAHTDDARRWAGWGTALKPAHEPICMARKPLGGSVAANVLRQGTGAINVDGCRIEGNRWPANFIHDGSDEATDGLRDAARYFYTAKASSEDRDEMLGDVPRNMHPTVKPTDLMRYLVRMVTIPGGTVLDPFTGSGSTGRAAMLEGMRFIGCELSPEYAEIARARIRYTLGPMFAHLVV